MVINAIVIFKDADGIFCPYTMLSENILLIPFRIDFHILITHKTEYKCYLLYTGTKSCGIGSISIIMIVAAETSLSGTRIRGHILFI